MDWQQLETIATAGGMAVIALGGLMWGRQAVRWTWAEVGRWLLLGIPAGAALGFGLQILRYQNALKALQPVTSDPQVVVDRSTEGFTRYEVVRTGPDGQEIRTRHTVRDFAPKWRTVGGYALCGGIASAAGWSAGVLRPRRARPPELLYEPIKLPKARSGRR